MVHLNAIAAALNEYFDIPGSGVDPAFSRFLPAVYDGAPRAWKLWVEPQFAQHFNGLMLRGSEFVTTVFLAAFPSAAVLQAFLKQANSGDLLFVHHPIDLESGDPRGAWGKFFQPIADDTIQILRARQLSIYSCHAPLDYHPTLNTSASIAAALGATVVDRFFPYGRGHAGVIASVPTIAIVDLEVRLQSIFDVPYLDVEGARPAAISRIAIVAGAGDRVEHMRHAEAVGANAYITGEIHSRIDTEYGHQKFADVEEFAASSRMALLGVSHAASEYLVMKVEMQEWFKQRFAVETHPLAEPHWWR